MWQDDSPGILVWLGSAVPISSWMPAHEAALPHSQEHSFSKEASCAFAAFSALGNPQQRRIACFELQ